MDHNINTNGQHTKDHAHPWSVHMKLSDLVESNYKLLPVLERLGISPGFGEKRIDQACPQVGVSTDFFFLLCYIHTFVDFTPEPNLLAGTDIGEIITYLHNSHEYYSQRQIPRLKEKLQVMVENCDPSHSKLLGEFFDNYQNELLNHFQYEENNVFPYVHNLLQGRMVVGYSIEQFEENHSNIEEKLNDLKNIILKYLPGTCNPAMRNEVLFDIFQLEEDLDKHTMIENRILIPLVSELEKKTL